MPTQSTQSLNTPDPVYAVLQELGLTDTEYNVFINLLRHGSRQAGTLSKQTDIRRAHVYGILERLMTRGLVSVHEKNGIKHFSALSLNDLLVILQLKENTLAEKRKQLKEVISTFQTSEVNNCSDPKSNSFRGPDAHYRLFQELRKESLESGIVFCSASKSNLFEGQSPSKAQLFQLSHILPRSLKIVLFSSNMDLLQSAADLHLDNLITFQGEFTVEMIVHTNKVMIIGQKAGSLHIITVEQPALAEFLRTVSVPLMEKFGQRKAELIRGAA